MVVKCALSLFVILDVPSAKLAPIEFVDLLIWLISPNFSSSGKVEVTL